MLSLRLDETLDLEGEEDNVEGEGMEVEVGRDKFLAVEGRNETDEEEGGGEIWTTVGEEIEETDVETEEGREETNEDQPLKILISLEDHQNSLNEGVAAEDENTGGYILECRVSPVRRTRRRVARRCMMCHKHSLSQSPSLKQSQSLTYMRGREPGVEEGPVGTLHPKASLKPKTGEVVVGSSPTLTDEFIGSVTVPLVMLVT